MKLAFSTIILCLVLVGYAPFATTRLDADARDWSGQALKSPRAVAAPAAGLPSETAALAELSRFKAAHVRACPGDQVDVAAHARLDSLARPFAQGAADPRRVDVTWIIAAQPRLSMRQTVDARGRKLARPALSRPTSIASGLGTST